MLCFQAKLVYAELLSRAKRQVKEPALKFFDSQRAGFSAGGGSPARRSLRRASRFETKAAACHGLPRMRTLS
jgi:hypothetical protein